MNATSETRVAPWHAARASLRQMVGFRNREMGSSGVQDRLSCRNRRKSDTIDAPAKAKPRRSASELKRRICPKPRRVEVMKIAKRTSPAQSKRQGLSDARARAGRRSTNKAATRPIGKLTRKT